MGVNSTEVITGNAGITEDQAKPMRPRGGEAGKCMKSINWRDSKPYRVYPLEPAEMRIYYHPSILRNCI